ncbi:MAG: TonB-dependent receptor [Caulobacteraceae bacterium]|nr:TonB-dependent receptor [Caulobacteraceae bacterium]
MTSNRKTRYMSGVALLFSTSLMLGLSPAHAEADAAAPAAGQDAGAEHPGEVTVFARKRAESVQQVPIPVTVLTAKELARENLVNFSDFQFKFPAFSVYLTNPKQLNLGIRGIGNNGFNTDGIDASVGVFVDGVYTGRPGMVSGDFNDIAQVDLLRGPQGTLFGKNTTAGAVIINTEKPSFTPQLAAEATGGNEGLQQYKISASGPIIADKLAARLSAFYSDIDGNYSNAYNGGKANARQGEGVRLQLLGKLTDKLTVRMIGALGSQDFNSIAPVTLSIYNANALKARMAAAGYTLVTGDASNRRIDINSAQTSVTHSGQFSTEADYDLGEHGSLTSITAYQTWSCYTNNDNDYTQLDAIQDYGSCNRESQFSQEARWASQKGGPVEAVAGAFFSSQDLQVDSRVRFGSQYNIWAANPSATAFPTRSGVTWAQGAYANALTGAGFRSQAKFHTTTEAIFGNVTWHPDVDKKWALDLGLRQTWESKRMTYNGWVASNPGGLTQTQLNAMSSSGANAQLGQAKDSITDSSLSGEVSVSYRFTPDVMGYVLFSRGYKSKGFNLLPENSSNPDANIALAIAHGASQDIKGEQADNVELGVKSQWLNRHLLVNATVFDTLVTNAQANEAIGVGNTATKFLANVGAERSKGVELEGEGWIVGGLHLKGFVSYNIATYASFRNSVCPAELTALSCDLTGRQVAWAPKWTTDLTVDYSREIIPNTTSYIVYDVNWRSDQNTTITLDPLANIKGYALMSLRVGTLLRHNTIDAQLWVENLTDEAYYINLLGLTKSTGIVQGYPGNPRTFGGTIKVRF